MDLSPIRTRDAQPLVEAQCEDLFDRLAMTAETEADVGLDDLVAVTITAFRGHGHIGNVMTHICDGRWDRLATALRAILDPRARAAELNPLAVNLVDLLCAERGVTGRILKPRFEAHLARLLPAKAARRLIAHVACLAADRQARSQTRPSKAPPESGATGAPIVIARNGYSRPVGPLDPQDRAAHEALIRDDYARCHPGEDLDALKARAVFTKEDKGLYADWMALAVVRAAARRGGGGGSAGGVPAAGGFGPR